ncbi:hypothetical protein SCOCK_140103 [Actinacidiphila cocklensis]|uniref:Uncharacterized protein n=1 Tax=Actinacidiphila cocklensis TaxID=887465 RepID=A0A9W4GNZ6_9ACTN|nr:hypothetical protein SCOCK_140103 [Actinacidiphila cocklensis]
MCPTRIRSTTRHRVSASRGSGREAQTAARTRRCRVRTTGGIPCVLLTERMLSFGGYLCQYSEFLN